MSFVPRLAHEVYVLTPDEVASDRHRHDVSLFGQLVSSAHDRRLFLTFAAGILVVVLMALWLKSWRLFRRLGVSIDRLGGLGIAVIRVVFGASFIFASLNHAVYGPELPISGFTYPGLLQPGMFILGCLLIVGIGTRVLGAVAAVMWLMVLAEKGVYALTYVNYLGEAIALLLIRKQPLSLDALLHRGKAVTSTSERWAMPMARILFGVSILYAAINIKFLAPAVSLDVVERYHLTNYFHFDPMFVVLGAAMIEALIGVLYCLGLLQRLTTVVFVIFMTLSILYFKESVWPHYLLFGLGVGIFLHRPDVLAVDRYLFASDRQKKAASSDQ